MSLSRSTGILALAIGLLVALASGAQAASLQTVGTGFDEPVYLTSAPDNPDRLFVVERKGRVVEVLPDGSRSVFADLRTAVGCEGDCGGERGLLSIALAPGFASSGRFFLFYGEDQGEGDIHVAEMQASATFAPLSTLRDVLAIDHPARDTHYGGQLQFGPEGNLFISIGDGGGANDPDHNAQDTGSPLGKILRIRPNPGGLPPYTVPAGNPFGNEVWALGVRNPFRFSFDRGGSGLWIGDVGQGALEEVDHGPAPGLGAGFNFGWSCFEGTLPGNGDDPACDGKTTDEFVAPVFEYQHIPPAEGCPSGFAIIGGYVSRDPGIGELLGRYVYGDLCDGRIRSFAPSQPFASDRFEGMQAFGLNSFGEDSCGRLYAISGAGAVHRIVGAAPTGCAVVGPGAAAAVLNPSFVGIKPLRRQVLRNRRGLLTAWVSPCKGRQGDPVTLWRGRKRIGTRRFDKVCTARFRPRISRRSKFRATVKADDTYVAAISRKVTIKPKKRKRRHR